MVVYPIIYKAFSTIPGGFLVGISDAKAHITQVPSWCFDVQVRRLQKCAAEIGVRFTTDSTLPEIAPKNGWLEYYFPIEEAYFQGRTVSFREGTLSPTMEDPIYKRKHEETN